MAAAAVTISPSLLVRIAAIFLLLAGAGALLLAARLLLNADGLLAVLTGLALAINGIALGLLSWSPAVFNRAPGHWQAVIVVFAVAVAIELLKRLL